MLCHLALPSGEVLAKGQALSLVVGRHLGAVKALRPGSHPFVDEPADHLSVGYGERHVSAANFEDAARSRSAGAMMSERAVEKTGLVNSELAE